MSAHMIGGHGPCEPDCAVAAGHACSPEACLALIGAHDGPVIVDFDETLYLSNSTEDFLDTARPGWLAKLVLKCLDIIKPWRLTGGEATRDNWRIAVIGALFPWVWLAWRLRARTLARNWRNDPLVTQLRGHDVLVASVGFRPIIAPLLAAIGGGRAYALCACRILVPADRLAGKNAAVLRARGPAFLRESLVVTDSAQDATLLAGAARRCLTVWPGARWQEALSGVYLPFEYVVRVKRSRRYVWTSILQEDYAFWVLASLGAGMALVPHLAGLALLLLSFWTIYETGYVDNDRIAATREAEPRLAPAFKDHRVPTPPVAPWVWAAATGYFGNAVLAGSWLVPLGTLLAWAGVLVGTSLCFRGFTRLDKRSRIWPFGLLQLARIASFAAVVPLQLAGAAALCAHFVAMWLPYLVYRSLPEAGWPHLPVATLRLGCFIVFAGLFFLAVPVTGWDLILAALLLLWNLLRTRKELPAILRGARRIGPPASPKGGGTVTPGRTGDP